MLLGAVLAVAGGPGFRTPHLLEDHFARFGSQFGNIDAQQYVRLAQKLRDAPAGRNILVAKRPDGGAYKFDLKRGWFVAYDADGSLRTFFIPREGVRFFNRQQKSAAPAE